MITKHNTDRPYSTDTRTSLSRIGWAPYFQAQIDTAANDKFMPARVTGVRKNSFHVSDGNTEWLATLAGRLQHHQDSLYPATGDWVLMNDTVISRVLERKNALSRGTAGTRGKQEVLPVKEQVIAANLDTVFVVSGLDRDFNLRRLERYMTLIHNCALNPVIVLTKADLHQDPERFARDVEPIAPGVPVHLVSALDSLGTNALESYLGPGQTIALIGSSGAGKSTLANRLYGKPIQATDEVNDRVGKGRHITTTRDLIMMPQGGVIIDNPGIREIALWDDDKGIESTFPEIEDLSGECRFSNCSHTSEPGCRILQAITDGDITEGRLASYQKMKRELAHLSERQHKSANRLEKERWKEVSLKVKAIKKGRPR